MDCMELRKEIEGIEKAIENAKKKGDVNEEEAFRRILSDLNKQYEAECDVGVYRTI